jgi:glutamyl-tRNA synthetase
MIDEITVTVPVVSPLSRAVCKLLSQSGLAKVALASASADAPAFNVSRKSAQSSLKSYSFSSDYNTASYLGLCYGLANADSIVYSEWSVAKPESIAGLEKHLLLRTFISGHQLTFADILVWQKIQVKLDSVANSENIKRWLSYMNSVLGENESQSVSSTTPAAPAAPTTTKKMKPTSPETSESANRPPRAPREPRTEKKDEANMENKLKNAEFGKVVTRFPPEPSGYLHIGHAKALIINDFFARSYGGKLIVRFDDTNPCKEKMEFEEAILSDIGLLGIKPDLVTYTSDSFSKLQDLAIQLIKDGLAYVDDTPVDVMRDQRGKGVESVCRSGNSVEKNLELFQVMLQGTELGQKCCLRAKISMTHKNKCMRDPVLYRTIIDTPHHRFGFQFKAYPTYDFACPVVDSIEGVTHACRTIEYADRDEQYAWVIEACKLRSVEIYEFSKTNFVNTCLSKRKLTWFVDNNVVEGWHDPRFPTIRGILRRGLTLEALREFVLTQGASRATNLMEWDKIWAINKQKIDLVVPRYAAVDANQHVELFLTDAPEVETVHMDFLHPKSPELGKKAVITFNKILLEKEDAKEIEAGEEVTLLHWGNVIVDRIEKLPSSLPEHEKVIRLVGHLNLAGSVKTTKRKLHWVPQVQRLTTVILREFDHLITKKKLEEDDDFKQFVNPVSIHDTFAVGDPLLKNLQKGDKVQLERRGYYIVDEPATPKNGFVPVFIFIPDGKTKAMSNIQGKVDLSALAGKGK